MKTNIQLTVAICVLGLSLSGTAQVPPFINYQGRLLMQDGTPMVNETNNAADGQIDLVFRIFDVQTGGVENWSQTNSDVAVYNGLFSVLLNNLNTNVFPAANQISRWLEVEVSDLTVTNILWPRKEIVSVAYAIQAGNADRVDGKHASEFLVSNIWMDADSTTNYLARTGGTMSGPLNMGGQIITNTTYYGDGHGLTNLVETDPQVADNMASNSVPRWNSATTQLVTGSIYNDPAGNIGIGTSSPAARLDVNSGAIIRGPLNMVGQIVSNVSHIDFNGNDVSVGRGANGSSNGVAMGYQANGSSNGAAMGYQANGTNYGAAMGYYANGSFLGAAIGRYANAANYGVAIGNSANGSASGAAIGLAANGTNFGAAVGYYAYGSYYGAAMGRSANGTNFGAAMGYYANGSYYGAAIGREASGTNRGAAMGCYADGSDYGAAMGYRANGANTNVAIGAMANAQGGTQRIAIGNKVTNDLNNTARIRGTLYLDGGTGLLYRATFGSGTWSNLGSVIDHGSLLGLTNDDHTQYHNDNRGDTRYAGAGWDTTTRLVTAQNHIARTNNPHSLTWTQLKAYGMPAGFADDVDNVGITNWAELTTNGMPAGFADGIDDVGITNEVDPQVGVIANNYVPRWNSATTQLVTGSIYDNGNVGIGTASVGEKLTVLGNIHMPGTYKVYFHGGAADPNYYVGTYPVAESGGMEVRGFGGVKLTDSAGVLQLTGGNVGIGTTSPDPYYKLDVNGHAFIRGKLLLGGLADGGDFRIQTTIQGYENGLPIIQFLALRTLDHWSHLVPAVHGFKVANYNNTQNNLILADNGDLWIYHDYYGRNYYFTSDDRLKFNEQKLEYGLAQVMALEPKRYDRADWEYDQTTEEIIIHPEKTTNEIGLVAQDVQAVIPEAVSVPENENSQLWSLSYSTLVPVLVKAIQEQQAQIESLKQRIETLEQR